MLTSLSIVLAVALGVGNADRAKPAVEHWRAEGGGYALTFYPGFASRAYIQEPSGEIVELYRQGAPFDVRAGVATKHQLRLNGASLDESIAIAIDDRKHDIAEIRIALYARGGLRTLVLENGPVLCPPLCPTEKAAGPVHAARMLADAGRFDAPETAVSTRGYDVAFYGGFASRITSSVAGELFRQSKPFDLGDSSLAGRHQVRIAGGPSQRDITLGVIDGEHQIAEIRLVLYGETNETIDVKNRAVTCPPDC